MTAERDIAAFALPFAAGVFAAVYISVLYNPTPALFTVMAAIFAVILSHPVHKRLSGKALFSMIISAAVLCGLAVGTTSEILSSTLLPKSEASIGWVKALSSSMKEMIAAIHFENGQSNAILTALITGDRGLLSEDTVRSFRESGASHILALSGMHLGIIYGILRGLLSPLGNSLTSRIIRSGIIVSICGIYTLATGAGASITRALIFIILGETAAMTGRYKSTGSILLASLLLQLAISPSSATDIGFQLSYAAMAGIAYIFPWLKGLWRNEKYPIINRPMRWIWNSACMSIACQLTTGPLAWIYFGSLPQYFILTNLLALPLVGLIIPAGLLTMALDGFGICPAALSWITDRLISSMSFILETIASL